MFKMSGFYKAFFFNIDQSAVHLISLPLEIRQLRYNVQGILIILDGAEWINIPSNYLITLRSTKQLRLSILPKGTNTLALVGLELTV